MLRFRIRHERYFVFSVQAVSKEGNSIPVKGQNMTSLSFVPLSLIDDDASLARQLAPAKPPIIFGREAVFIDAEASALPAMRGSPPLSPPWEISTGNILAAVVQKGRLFQRAHPDVTVIRDRGRFLLVELPPGHPILSEKPTEPCFSAYRLEPGAEVFRDLDPVEPENPARSGG